MVNGINFLNQAEQIKVSQKNLQKREQKQLPEQSQSIFTEQNKAEKGKGLGLGNGEIPPGIQKKIDSGSVPASLIEKFPHIQEAVDSKKADKPEVEKVKEGPAAIVEQIREIIANLTKDKAEEIKPEEKPEAKKELIA